MAFNRGRLNPAQLEAREERRRRENSAPRLHDVVPKLTSLRLRLEEEVEAGKPHNPPYTQLVVVATSPALFTVRCLEPRCSGVHDLTEPILQRLVQSETRLEGSSTCGGEVDNAPCKRVLHYVCEAEFAS